MEQKKQFNQLPGSSIAFTSKYEERINGNKFIDLPDDLQAFLNMDGSTMNALTDYLEPDKYYTVTVNINAVEEPIPTEAIAQDRNLSRHHFIKKDNPDRPNTCKLCGKHKTDVIHIRQNWNVKGTVKDFSPADTKHCKLGEYWENCKLWDYPRGGCSHCENNIGRY